MTTPNTASHGVELHYFLGIEQPGMGEACSNVFDERLLRNRPVNPEPASGMRLSFRQCIGVCLALMNLGGCASYGVIENTPVTDDSGVRQPYSVNTWAAAKTSDDITFILAFSGGGTRAAAMAYGVLEELRDTNVVIDGRREQLLDEVDYITSVSGEVLPRPIMDCTVKRYSTVSKMISCGPILKSI